MEPEDLQRIVDSQPGLTRWGYQHFDDPQQAESALIHPDEDLPIFEQAVWWIQLNLEPSKRINPNHTSYGLKHLIEAEIGYLPNGICIAAMAACGYQLRRLGKDARFNVTTRSIKRSRRRQRRVLPPASARSVFQRHKLTLKQLLARANKVQE